MWHQSPKGDKQDDLVTIDPDAQPSLFDDHVRVDSAPVVIPQPSPIPQPSGSWQAVEALCIELSNFKEGTALATRLLQGLCDLLQADSGDIMLADSTKGVLRVVARVGPSDGLSAQTVSLEGSAGGIVISAGRPMLLRGAASEQGQPPTAALRTVKCSLLIPIGNDGKFVGVVTLNRLPARPSFVDADMEAAVHVIGSFSAVLATADEAGPAPASSISTTIQALAQTIEAKDPYTRGHCDRVRSYACDIAEKMGLDSTFIDNLVMGASLHDIGKIGVPEAVLTKPGKLTDEEFDTIKRHPVVGVEIVRSLGLPPAALAAIQHHHERFDGGGYPGGLKGSEIPLSARILAVADAFDAMTISRPYRPAMSVSSATEELRRRASTQFDPVIVTVFVKHCQQQKSGQQQTSIEAARKRAHVALANIVMSNPGSKLR
jgi:putative nucleotidyltransferase with HDIG domain